MLGGQHRTYASLHVHSYLGISARLSTCLHLIQPQDRATPALHVQMSACVKKMTMVSQEGLFASRQVAAGPISMANIIAHGAPCRQTLQ